MVLHKVAKKVQINVKLYGGLRKHALCGQTDFLLKIEPVATLKDVLNMLSIPQGSYVALVNDRRVTNDAQFINDATLVLFPPVSGG